MSAPNRIQYLKQQQIDKVNWDRCIHEAPNGLIYAYSFYLDHMAKHWDALILNDYEAVMPLTWNRKYGFRYLYQPFLCAQLGIFGKGLSEKHTSNFMEALPSSFRYTEILLNHENLHGIPNKSCVKRSNYLLSLAKPYEELYKGYNENIQRNVKRALQAGCSLQKDFDAERVIELAMQQMKAQGDESTDNVNRFRKLYLYLYQKKMATTYGIVSSQEKLLASCVFFFSHDRAYYILVGNHPAGRNMGASHALIDAFIKDHAGEKLLLDFEGSDIPTLADFYRGFGATNEPYPALRINRLPFYLKWLKKS
ncbi:MAG TPA: GNAT family N-acetyltransferase [Chitinophagaceae bacterium]|nr:GNAT family N-acetyltransferase [Chitinophagaceae bacterium]